MSRSIEQDRGEELANALTHGSGALISIAGLILLLLKAQDKGSLAVVSVALYGSAMILLYSASAMYHGTISPRVKSICQILDHSSIYLLIAGTYTPISLITLGAGWGWSIFGIVWGCAVAGIATQILFPGRYRTLVTASYVAMGWIAVIALYPLFQAMPLPGFIGIFIGGILYTSGVYFYIKKRFRFSHSVWHLFVLGGSVSHWITIYLWVL